MAENQQVEIIENEVNTIVSSNPEQAKQIEVQNPTIKNNQYEPVSESCLKLESVVPPNMRYEMYKALETVDRRVNGVDEYVAEKLQYVKIGCTIDERKEGLKCLCDAFGAEQVDAIATAIYNIENKGQGIIIGDSTGLGKGRQAAAILRYGIINGKQPIFLTEKPGLFTDIMRDIIDIGSDDAIPIAFFSEYKEFKRGTEKEDDDGDDGIITEDSEGAPDEQMEINSDYFKKATFVINKEYEKQIRGKKLMRPFIVNGRGEKTNIKDGDGNILYKGLSSKETMNIIKEGRVPKEYKAIFATYSQFRSKTISEKMIFLQKVSKDNIIVMDESHNSSGDSNTGIFLKSVLEETMGVCFLSATFAKRPDNMPIYAAKTCISDANLTNEGLVEAIEKGGVALQEVISSQLVSEGQMVRRERSFEGIVVNFNYLDDSQNLIGLPQLNKAVEHRAIFDKTTKIIRDIIVFQRTYVRPFIKDIDKMIKAELGQAEVRKGTSDAGISNPPEFSGIFNIISQLLFSLKAEAVADVTIMRLKEGKKPVIAFANTMESFLDNITDDSGELVKIGDVVYADFVEVLKRRLTGVLRYTITKSNGDKEFKSITRMEMMEMQGMTEAYDKIMADIKKTVTGISISPIDVVKQRIEEAGFTVGEVTGRDRMLKLRKDKMAVVMRRPQMTSTDAFRKFNHNELDCLMINQSGSTGASAHAMPVKNADGSFKVPPEKVKQRCMVILQAELNINTEVQKRGRINRTGQIHKPQYDYVISAIPAEMRLMMMLQKKLKSLDANTTSNQKQSKSILDIPDFLNKYGDEEVVEWLKENPLLNALMDDPLKLADANEEDSKGESGTIPNAAHKVSGRVAILDISDQERFYSEMAERYSSTVEYKRETGEYDLEVEYYNLEAETIKKEVISEGNPDAQSVFGRNTILEKCKVNSLKKPYTQAELQNILEAELKGEDSEMKSDKLITEHNKFVDSIYENEKKELAEHYTKLEDEITKEKGYSKAAADGEGKDYITQRKDEIAEGRTIAERKLEMAFTNKRDVMNKNFRFFTVGKVVAYPSSTYASDNVWYKAVFLGFDIKPNLRNPYAPSSVKMKFAIANTMKYIAVPGSKFDIINSIKALTYENILSYDEEETVSGWDSLVKESMGDKETRYIITGNILQGFGKLQQKAKLISYTLKGGGIKKGILLPLGFDPNPHGRDVKPLKITVPIIRALPIIKSMLDGRSMTTADNLSIIRRANDFMISVPLKRITGGKFYENDILKSITEEKTFNKSGSQMIASVSEKKIDNIVKFLHNEFNSTVELNRTEYDMIGGKEAQTDYNDEVDYKRGQEIIEKLTEQDKEAERLFKEQEQQQSGKEFEEQEREALSERLLPLKIKLQTLMKFLQMEQMVRGGSVKTQPADPNELKKAHDLGQQAFKDGRKLIPYHDPALMKMLEGKEIGQGVPIMDSWMKGWHTRRNNESKL